MNNQDVMNKRICKVKIETSKVLEKYFKLLTKLGEGTFGVVVSAVDLRDNSVWALKKIVKGRKIRGLKKSWENEFQILSKINHPNIIKLKEMFETEHYAYLILEYCDGLNLGKSWKKRGKLPEYETSYILSKIGSALSYLHQRQIVHRDIKLENIFLLLKPTITKEIATNTSSDDDISNSQSDVVTNAAMDVLYEVKLGDFGLAVDLRKQNQGNSRMLEFCGTPMYMAPEIVTGKSYTQQCDVWSVGIIMFMLSTGAAPFKSHRESLLFNEISTFNFEKLCSCYRFSNSAKYCLSRLLHFDPAYRYSAQEFTLDKWVRQTENPCNKNDFLPTNDQSLDSNLSLDRFSANIYNSKGMQFDSNKSPMNILELMKEFNNPNHMLNFNSKSSTIRNT